MARPQKPNPGRLIVSVVHSSRDALADALRQLERRFGRVTCETIDIQHSNGREYAEEMGDTLYRRLFSFERMVPRDSLVEIKTACHKIESQLGDQVHDYTFRTVNIDPGIMTPDNFVMACHREFNHRIYINEGVFAEIVLIWSKGKFCRLPWTNQDFCHEEAIDFFSRVRNGFELLEREPLPQPSDQSAY
jgi:hypothetical protein